ncbi:P-type conjugative transfer protein TrbG [uncultured Desulfobacterium sp.]|uniref:P-type conjugative transfer protein TrbG n=1 Tax=uncultured Desulfobacterium sp. TaxID=201089 RepID=A0A445MSJ2_9BACT|nr:P-type conjugative transfer protein TrbG [uncultured Desulfobacterium sp.]
MLLGRIFLAFIYLMAIANFFLVGCAHRPANISYVEAVKKPEPDPPVKIIETPVPLPLPNQLKPVEVPSEASKLEAKKKPYEVIEEANKGAKQHPEGQDYFNSIMQYTYAPGALYQVYCAPLKLTDIQLQPGEEILGKPACGDTIRWVLGLGLSQSEGQTQQHIYLKPTKPGLQTSLNINTNRRSYLFEIHSYTKTYMAAVSFRYPHDELTMAISEQTKKEEANKVVTSPVVSLENLNFGYIVKVFKGRAASWLPLRVFDDGVKTFIQFPKDMPEAPVLFVLSDKNEMQLVNYRVRNEFYIVDRLFNKAEFRLGRDGRDIVRIFRTEKLSSNRNAF